MALVEGMINAFTLVEGVVNAFTLVKGAASASALVGGAGALLGDPASNLENAGLPLPVEIPFTK